MADWTTHIANALLNSVWQGLALAALAALYAALNRRASAAARYAVWYAALLATLALSVMNLVRFDGGGSVNALPSTAAGPMASPAPFAASPASDVSPEPAPSGPPAVFRLRLPIEVPAGPAAFGLAVCWMLAAAGLLIRLGAATLHVIRLKRTATPPPDPMRSWWRRWRLECPSVREPELVVSDAVRVPLTAGFVAPAVIFPRRLLEYLTEKEAHAAWLHELAHIQRLDDWTKLGQKLSEALLCFHPAVHWIGRRLEMEREIACDDWVVRQTGEPKPYAACLAKIATFTAAKPDTSLAPAMAMDKKRIFWRVKMLVNKNRTTIRESRVSGWLGAAAVATVAAGLAFAGPLVVLAQVPEPPAAPVVPPPPAVPEPPARAPLPPAGPTESAAVAVPAVPAIPAVPAPPAVPAAEAAPPVPPKPQAQPAPAPAPSPEADESRSAERQAVREEIRKYQDEIRELSRQISEEVRTHLKPRMEEIRRQTEAIRAEVEKSIRPSTAEISRLSAELARLMTEAKPDQAKMRELEAKIKEINETTIRQAEERIREFEEQLRDRELDFRPSEETMRKFEERMRELERRLQEKLKEFEAKRTAKPI